MHVCRLPLNTIVSFHSSPPPPPFQPAMMHACNKYNSGPPPSNDGCVYHWILPSWFVPHPVIQARSRVTFQGGGGGSGGPLGNEVNFYVLMSDLAKGSWYSHPGAAERKKYWGGLTWASDWVPAGLSKRSATIGCRGAHPKIVGFTNPPDGRKRHFPSVLSCMYPALK